MGVVIPIVGPRSIPLSPYDEFTQARRAMLRAYVAWLKTRPEALCVLEEVAGTHGTMDQLRQLEPSHG